MKDMTNGELQVVVEDLKDHLGTKIDTARMFLTDSINRVEAQTVKTNGRVSALEKRSWMAAGALAVVMAIVIPMVVYVWNEKNRREADIHSAVNNAFQQRFELYYQQLNNK